MKSSRNRFVLLATIALVGSVLVRAYGQTPPPAPASVTLWDTGTPFGDTIDLQNRAQWKAVPPNLLLLEADPPKAASDPGYYGREYAFQGDAVVENSYLTALVQPAKGTVAVFSKTGGDLKFEIRDPQSASISRCALLQNTGNEVALDLSFGAQGSSSAVLAFDKTPIVAIKPGGNLKTLRIQSPLEYGIAPSFIGDDLVLGARQYSSTDTLCVPAESLFLGLLKGEGSMLVMTWPQGKQQMKLGLSKQGQEGRLLESIDFGTDSRNVYLALLEAPGIWHREALGAAYLEKDVASSWKRPFPAKWVTQLWEGNVRTTYTFRDAPGQIWRGVAGHYSYPIWFQGDHAFYRLSKKVLPKGESIVYFLEGQATPASVWTPADILKATLGRPACDSILDLAGRKLRTHHRRGAEGIRRACTCGCTEAIEAVFKAGQEVEKKEYIEGAVGDMVYFVTRHMERLDEYRTFADDLLKFLRTTAASQPELQAYCDNLAA
ncbi:MAG: hypothetical protein MUC88_22070, partial [Planctomycetes bacterium]|nr:hypothetical protein [Planctomycetota bacterium]